MKMMHVRTNRNLQQIVLLVLCGLSLLALPVFAAAGDATLTMVDGGLLQEKSSGRMWQMERSKKISSAAAAEQYLRQLNQGPQKDWRLPTKGELYDLLTIFDLKKNGGITLELAGDYWLTDDNGATYAGAWETGDQCGPERTFYRGKSGYVRAVRP